MLFRSHAEKLSPRLVEMATLAIQMHTNEQICEKLNLSPRNVVTTLSKLRAQGIPIPYQSYGIARYTKNKDNEILSLVVPKDMAEKLRLLARQSSMTLSSYMREQLTILLKNKP